MKEHQEALDSIAEDSVNFKIVLKVSTDKKTLDITYDDDLEEITYSRTEKLLAAWAQIRDKYLPESDRWKLDPLQKSDSLYENEERLEEKKKFDFYQARATSDFWTLVPFAQFRLSLMSIFNLADNFKFVELKAKKLKNQLRIAILKIEQLVHQNDGLNRENNELRK